MGRPTNKEKYIRSIFNEIEQSQDTDLKTIYVCLLKEKIDAYNYDYKTLLYDQIYQVLDNLYDIMQKLNIKDENHTFIMDNIKAVLGQQYWSMYMDTLLKENIVYGCSNNDQQ